MHVARALGAPGAGLLARLEPTSRVIANGFLHHEKSESFDVAVGASLHLRDDFVAPLGLEEVREALLRAQVVLDRHLPADLRDRHDVAVLGLEDGEQPALGGEPSDLDRVARVAAPAQRAGDEDVQVARRRAAPSRARPSPRGRAGRRPSPSPRTGSRAPWRSAARFCPVRTRSRGRARRPAWWRCERPAASRRSAGRRCSCTPRCRNRRTARRRRARTCPTGSRSRCRRSRRHRPAR